jgi:hypothetical protein
VYIDPYDLRAHELLAEIYEGSATPRDWSERSAYPVLTGGWRSRRLERDRGIPGREQPAQ